MGGEHSGHRLQNVLGTSFTVRPGIRYQIAAVGRSESGDDPPTLIIHGDEDTAVPLAQGEAAHRALAEAGATTRLLVIEGSGHTFRYQHAEEALTAAVAWFVRHLQE